MGLYQSFPTIVSNSITAGNALVDSTTANAFCAPVGLNLGQYRRDMVEFWSGTTLWAQAWISATAPSGENLAESLFVNSDFASDEPPGTAWATRQGGWTITGGKGVKTAGAGLLCQAVGVEGKLYRSTLDIDALSVSASIALTDGDVATGVVYTATGSGQIRNVTYKRTLNGGYFISLAATATIDNAALQNVTMPAATGALLLSTPGGTRGWAYKHASFNPNAAMTMRILTHRKIARPLKYMGVSTFHN